MRKEFELMQLIENYLQNKMSASEKEAFEKRIQSDAALQKEVELQRQVMKGIENVGLKQSVSNALKKYKFNKNLKNWGLTGLTIAILAAGSVFVYKSVSKQHTENALYELPELNEQGEKLWSDADKYLAPQQFELYADKDTVVETADGIVISIPANSFLDANGKPVTGKIELEVKEALKATDILKAGLTTKSGDRLLETGGMFYINARKDGASLKINEKEGLRAQVPTNEVKPDMQLFEGKRLPNGTIDWVNPKPVSKDLVPVDIHSLNFYPPNYLDSLKSWGYDTSNKKFTDSLYYSFAQVLEPPSAKERNTEISGERIFRQNCAVCHSLGSNKITGPGLQGVISRVPGGDWLFKFIKNNDKLIKSGDPYAVKISSYDASQMTVFESTLSDEEIQRLIEYIKNNKYESSYLEGIDPLAIKVLQSDRFQNTLLATKEFEERMSYIHHICNPKILDMYILNLDKNLSTIDSMIGYSTEFSVPKFREFAARRDGSIKNGDKNVQLLTAYYQKKYNLFSEALAKTKADFTERQRKLDIEAEGKEMEHQTKEANRTATNFAEELNINLKDAYKQLGKDIPPPPLAFYSVSINVTGWNNVDRYVIQSLTSRTTMDYTDPNNGKKAVIEYNPFTVNVADYKNYDRTLVYLLPDELTSFMRLENKNEVFEEKVTKLMNYKLVCIAYKGEESFYFSEDNIKAGNHTVSLVKTDNVTIQNNINKLSKLSQVKAMNDELNYISFAKAEEKRQKKLEQQRVFENKVKNIIFPCSAPWSRADSTKIEHK